MARSDRLTISGVLVVAALLILALLLWEPPRYRGEPPAATPVVVTVTPYVFETPQPVVTMSSPPVPHHTASPARFDHLPRAVVTPEPTPTTLPALVLDPTETPEPEATPTPDLSRMRQRG